MITSKSRDAVNSGRDDLMRDVPGGISMQLRTCAEVGLAVQLKSGAKSTVQIWGLTLDETGTVMLDRVLLSNLGPDQCVRMWQRKGGWLYVVGVQMVGNRLMSMCPLTVIRNVSPDPEGNVDWYEFMSTWPLTAYGFGGVRACLGYL